MDAAYRHETVADMASETRWPPFTAGALALGAAGLLFASHAAVAYAAVRQQAGLIRSVATRQLIGQAQGILMERH